MNLRAIVITVLGIPVCTAILVGAIGMYGTLWLTGEPVSQADAIGAVVFSVLAAAVLAVALRASFRVWRHGKGAGDHFAAVAYLVPILVVAGAALGIVFIRSVLADQDRYHQDRAASECRVVLGEQASPAALAPCHPVAQQCRRDFGRLGKEALVKSLGFESAPRLPEGLRPMIADAKVETIRFCVLRRMQGQGAPQFP
jgi:hypothetical protein